MAKSASAGFPFRGFERPPVGALFEQLIEPGGPMGVAYERSVGFEKPMHTHDRVLFVCPRGETTMAVGVPTTGTYRVSARELLIVPAGVDHDDAHVTRIYDTFALLPSAELVLALVGPQAFARVALVERTALLDELLEDYFRDRVFAAPPSKRREHLEALLVLEVHRIARDARGGPSTRGEAKSPLTPAMSPVTARALRFIEANLFSAELDIVRVARAVGASRSSLLRKFQSDVGGTIGAYVQGRRLDEARALLAKSESAISEVAILVGYKNAGAFSEAYRRRFGAAPSSLRP